MLKMQDMKLSDQPAGHENAGHENGGPASNWFGSRSKNYLSSADTKQKQFVTLQFHVLQFGPSFLCPAFSVNPGIHVTRHT